MSRRPIFKVGDVVEQKREKPNAFGVLSGFRNKGVITHLLYEGGQPVNTVRIEYYVGSFIEPESHFTDYGSYLRLCKGMKSKRLCDQCNYRFQCWTTRRR